jgi:hypothetical protein
MRQRLVDAGRKQDAALGKFATWLRDDWGRQDVGTLLQFASGKAQEAWAAEYILLHYRKGQRGETLNRLRLEMGRAFRTNGGDAAIWASDRVINMVQSGKRNNNEQREYAKGQCALEKYPWNFGVLVAVLEMAGLMHGDFYEGMSMQMAEKAGHGLMILMMFELGPRMSNVTGEDFRRRLLGGPNEADEDDGTTEEEMSHAMIWSDWEFELICLALDGVSPLYSADGTYLTEWWIGGPRFWKELVRRNLLDLLWHVLWAKIRFLTGKTHRAAKSAAAAIKEALWGRRTTPESRGLDIFLRFGIWNGMPNSIRKGDGVDDVFRRKPMGGTANKPAASKKLRITDAVKWVKTIAQSKGVMASHVSSKGLRRGFVSTAFLFYQNALEARTRAVTGAQARGGQWEENSRVTEQVYLDVEDRGPLSMAESWDAGVKIGGGFEVWLKRQGAGKKRDEEA